MFNANKELKGICLNWDLFNRSKIIKVKLRTSYIKWKISCIKKETIKKKQVGELDFLFIEKNLHKIFNSWFQKRETIINLNETAFFTGNR